MAGREEKVLGVARVSSSNRQNASRIASLLASMTV